MIIKKISLMYTYTLKIIVNKITYSLGQLRKKQSHQIIDTISKYLLRCLVALYIAWFLMAGLFYEIFILSDGEMNHIKNELMLDELEGHVLHILSDH